MQFKITCNKILNIKINYFRFCYTSLTIEKLNKFIMSENKHKPAPGDGLRSLKSTILFRALNYELYVKPNKMIMLFGAITMLGCIGYITYMRQKYDLNYYNAVTTDGTVGIKKKTSKWIA